VRKLLAILLVGLALPAPVLAEEMPAASPSDTRMRYVAYDPGQVVDLKVAVGATMVVTFGDAETVTAVAVTDSKDLSAMPRGNFLFFKSKAELPAQPVIVLTKTSDGLKRYVFAITTTAAVPPSSPQPAFYYSVQFVYPREEALARQKAAAAKAAAARSAHKARLVAWRLHQAHNRLEAETRDPSSNNVNWHYVAQGDRSILPLEVHDNGFSTVFRFPGNVRIPSFYIINPDEHEATANYAVKGDLVVVDAVARGWRLRDGQTVLAIWNKAYDAIGNRPATGTTSAGVERQVREAPP
jgi:type IV secretion system protein VirB9